MNKRPTLTPELLSAMAELKGLDLTKGLLEKLLPLVSALLTTADNLRDSDIWQRESGNPLNLHPKEQ